MTIYSLIRLIILSVIICSIVSCAVQAPPSGGPVDKEPPIVIAHSPPDSSTGVDPGSKIDLEFSERMDKPTVASSIFISPQPENPFELKWKKNRLSVELDEPFRANQTYVVSVGSSAKDLRNNMMAATYTWAFSTGDSLDGGVITGQVFNTDEPAGMVVWAYGFDSLADPDLFDRRGDYMTQTDTEGRFVLPYIKPGKYRVFLFEDGDKDVAFNLFADSPAFPPGDVYTGTFDDAPFLRFIPAPYDTIAPQITMVRSAFSGQVNLILSELIDTVYLEEMEFFAHDTDNASAPPVPASGVMLSGEEMSDLTLFFPELLSGNRYQVEARGLRDMYGNIADIIRDSLTVFTMSSDEDTSGFFIEEFLPPISSEGAALFSRVTLRFNIPADPASMEGNIAVFDSNGTVVPVSLNKTGPKTYEFTPDDLLESLARYTVEIQYDSIQSISGLTLVQQDSSYSFVTRNSRRTGDLYGSVAVKGDIGEAMIRIRVIPDTGGGDHFDLTLEEPGSFVVRGLNPDDYSVFAYLDQDNNGRWSAGGINPFIPAEPFDSMGSGIAIRAGIDNRITKQLELEIY